MNARQRTVLATCVFLGLTACALWLQRRPDPPIPATGGQSLRIPPLSPIPYYLQADARWSAERLGVSSLHMADSGCVVTTVAMALAASGRPVSPLELCRSLNATNGFTADGLLLWHAVESIANESVEVTFPRLAHGNIDACLQAGTPVVAKLLLSPMVPHWVLIVGKQDFDYLIMDPLNRQNTVVPLSSRAAAIQSIRVIRRNARTQDAKRGRTGVWRPTPRPNAGFPLSRFRVVSGHEHRPDRIGGVAPPRQTTRFARRVAVGEPRRFV